MALGYRLQSNPLVGKLTTKYLLPLGTRQFGDDVVFFNFGYEADPPMGLPLSPFCFRWWAHFSTCASSS